MQSSHSAASTSESKLVVKEWPPVDLIAGLRLKKAAPETTLEENVLCELPPLTKVLHITPSGESAWVRTVRIRTRQEDGTIEEYFKKSQHGSVSRRMMLGTFASEKTLYGYAPQHVPKPIAWGNYKPDEEIWFYLAEYHDMVDEVPSPQHFVSIVVGIHQDSMGKSPKGKFGFDVPTHLANVRIDNEWEDTWENFFTKALKQRMELEELSHGNDDEEFTELKEKLLTKVIPRLLRPLESGGRKVVPCLIHSDLWPGNCMPDALTGQIMLFDSCAYWGHNESDLGSWRAPRYRMGQAFLSEYQKCMGKDHPEGDWDDRNALYALRHDLLVSSLFPNSDKFHDHAKEEMKRMAAKYPNGFEGLSLEPPVKQVFETIVKIEPDQASFSAMFSGLSSFIYYPSITAISRSLQVSIELVNLTITSYQIVSGIVPSILGDFADQNGRRPVCLIAFTLYFGANLGLALQNSYTALIVLRCLQSADASSTIALAYGFIADIAPPSERGSYVGIMQGFTNSAPSLGPILGGVLTETLSWHWIFWLLTIMSGMNLLVLSLVMPETSRKLVGDGSIRPARLFNRPILPFLLSPAARSKNAEVSPEGPIRIPNPFTCLATLLQRASFLVILVGGIQYTIYGCLAASFSTLMIQLYSLNYLTGGLIYLPCGIGGLLAAYTTGKLLDRDYIRTAKRYNLPVDKSSNDLTNYPIERARLRTVFPLLAVSTLATVGFGWALKQRTSIAVPLILTFFSGASQVAIFTVCGTLLTDLNPNKSATVQAAYSLIRCALSAGGIAGLQAMINAVGVGWCFTIYAAIGLLCIPIFVVLRNRGMRWRTGHDEPPF